MIISSLIESKLTLKAGKQDTMAIRGSQNIQIKGTTQLYASKGKIWVEREATNIYCYTKEILFNQANNTQKKKIIEGGSIILGSGDSWWKWWRVVEMWYNSSIEISCGRDRNLGQASLLNYETGPVAWDLVEISQREGKCGGFMIPYLIPQSAGNSFVKNKYM